MRLIKVRKETYNDLINLIARIEEKQPYLKGVVSFGVIINMLMLKNKVKLSKLKYLKKVKGGLKNGWKFNL